MGDGQKLALRLQSSRFYTMNSFSFTEPWLGGKKPMYYERDLDLAMDNLLTIVGRRIFA